MGRLLSAARESSHHPEKEARRPPYPACAQRTPGVTGGRFHARPHARPPPGLESLKKEAKRWLAALHAHDPAARARFERALPNAPATPTLRDAQLALAREHGFAGWPDLRRPSNRPAAARHACSPGTRRWRRRSSTRTARAPRTRSNATTASPGTGVPGSDADVVQLDLGRPPRPGRGRRHLPGRRAPPGRARARVRELERAAGVQRSGRTVAPRSPPARFAWWRAAPATPPAPSRRRGVGRGGRRARGPPVAGGWRQRGR